MKFLVNGFYLFLCLNIFSVNLEVKIGSEHKPVNSITDERYFKKSQMVIRDIEYFSESIWIAVWGKGIFVIDKIGNITNLTENEGLPGNFINDLEVSENYIYIASKDGVARANLEWDIEKSPWFNESVSLPVLHCVCLIDEDILLAGTTGDGVYSMDWKKRSVNRVLPSEWNSLWMNSIKKDKQNNLWFATGRGVFAFDSKFNILKVNGIPGALSVSANCLYKDDSFIASGSSEDGLILNRNKDFIYYSTFKERFPDNAVYHMCYAENKLWCGTGKGLAVISPENTANKSEVFFAGQCIRAVNYFNGKIFAGSFNGVVYELDVKSKSSNVIFDLSKQENSVE